MSKTTLKHALADGTIAKRQTARNYTHVVVGVFNTERALTNAAGRREPRERTIERATGWWKHDQDVMKAGVGGKVFYQRNQGGYYLNRTGPQQVVTDWMVESALKHNNITLEEAIERELKLEDERYAATVEHIRKTKTREVVMSWHGSAALAIKASAGFLYSAHDVRIEAINQGVRA